MNFKRICIFILLTTMVISLGLFVGGQAATGQKTTIEWMQWYAPHMKKGGMDRILDSFHVEHPEIQVELVTIPFGKMREQILTSTIVGKAGDVLGLNPPWNAGFVDANALEPLGSYLSSAREINPEDLAHAVIQEYKGQVWMVPLTAFPFVMFGNKDRMREAGIGTPPSTWEELKEVALKMTIPEKGQYGYAIGMSSLPPSNGPIIDVYPMLYTAGGRTVKNEMSNLDSPEVVETLKFLKGLNDSGAVAPGLNTMLQTQKVERFSAGEVAIILNNQANIETVYLRNPDLNLVVFPVPKKKKWAYRMHGWMLGISSKSKHKKEAWTLIEWLLTPQVNGPFSELSRQLPGNLAASLDITDPNIAICEYMLLSHEGVEELMLTKQAPASWRIFVEELQKMFADKQDPVTTAKNAHKRWNELFATAE